MSAAFNKVNPSAPKRRATRNLRRINNRASSCYNPKVGSISMSGQAYDERPRALLKDRNNSEGLAGQGSSKGPSVSKSDHISHHQRADEPFPHQAGEQVSANPHHQAAASPSALHKALDATVSDLKTHGNNISISPPSFLVNVFPSISGAADYGFACTAPTHRRLVIEVSNLMMMLDLLESSVIIQNPELFL